MQHILSVPSLDYSLNVASDRKAAEAYHNTRIIRAGCRRGLTLVELLVAVAVLALVLTAVCGVYFAIADEWERQQGQANGLVAASQACSRISEYISMAIQADASTLHQVVAGDTLVLKIPINLSYATQFVPSWSSTVITYQYIAFYLSDSTGNYSHTGTILWAGTVDTSVTPWNVTGDSTWSLNYGGWGSIRDVKSLSFSVDSAKPLAVRATIVSSSFRAGSSQKSVTITRTVRTRNPNAG